MKSLVRNLLILISPFLIAVGVSASGSQRPQTSLVSSSAQGCEFVVRFSPAFAELEPRFVDDSSATLSQAFFVAIPPGSRAEITIVEPSKAVSIDPSVLLNGRTLVSAPPVHLGNAVSVRGRELLPVIVCPVQGGTAYGEIRIGLSFRGGRTSGLSGPQDPFFERVVGRNLVNSAIARSLPTGASLTSSAVSQPAGFSRSSTWLELPVTSSGLHYVTGLQLRSAGLTSLASSEIRIFNGGGLPLPVDNNVPRPEFREVAVLIQDGGDGNIDDQDRIYFFGEAANRWVYSAVTLPIFTNNIYDSENVYWLAVGGTFGGAPARMQTIDESTPSPDTVITEFDSYVRVEQDNLLLRGSDGHIDSYYLWYWSDETSVTAFVPTYGAVPGDSARLKVTARTSGVSNTQGYVDLTVNGSRPLDRSRNTFSCTYVSYDLMSGLNEFAMALTPLVASASGYTPPYLNNIELIYRRQLSADNGSLDVRLTQFDAAARLQFSDEFTTNPLVLDISNPISPAIMSSVRRVGGALEADVFTENGSVNRYYATSFSVARPVEDVRTVSPVDLGLLPQQADLIVVTAERFVSDLDEYVAYRQARGITTAVVTVEDIMDNFSYGLTDPTAIRDFLKYAYETWPQPAPHAALLVGDANYDYRDVLNTGRPNYVPSYIHSRNTASDPTYSDDNYVYFGDYGVYDADTSFIIPDRGFDMMISRWPVSQRSELATIVSKIRQYEANETLGAWRNRVTYVADDEHGTFINIAEPFHTWDSEKLDTLYTPRHFQRRKVYMIDFPFVNTEKPAVNNAIVDAVNDGTLLINYVGHGNPDVWAHEHVFTRQTDLPRLSNTSELSMVIAASCAIGFFDDPLREGMGEDLLAMPSGGAVAVIAATRLVYALENALFNRKLYEVLFGDPDLSMCEAMYMTKLLRQYGSLSIPYLKISNDRAFAFLGGPFVKLGQPRRHIEVEAAPDSLKALTRSDVSGRVVNAALQTLASDGILHIAVVDSDRQRSHQLEIGSGSDIEFKIPGPIVYQGTAPIVAGEFAFSFVTPLDIGFGGNSARIELYAVLDTTDAAGLVDSLPVSGTVAATTDSAGPQITMAVAGRDNFVDGGAVGISDRLEVTISDSSGINLSSELGHGITIEIDGDPGSVTNVTDLFAYDPNDYTTGILAYALSDLLTGRHSIKVKAWDNANNSATASVSLDVVSSAALAIRELLNYPNPMADETTFYFDLTQDVVRFSLEIFTLAGRKVQSIARSNLPIGSHRIGWNGRDADGDRLATGVYIYKASAIPVAGGESVESFGKVVVVN
jgi:hypothetical protein